MCRRGRPPSGRTAPARAIDPRRLMRGIGPRRPAAASARRMARAGAGLRGPRVGFKRKPAAAGGGLDCRRRSPSPTCARFRAGSTPAAGAPPAGCGAAARWCRPSAQASLRRPRDPNRRSPAANDDGRRCEACRRRNFGEEDKAAVGEQDQAHAAP